MKPLLTAGILSWAMFAAAGCLCARGAEPGEISAADREFFEKSIRPILVEKCYSCHSTQDKKLRGGLLLDSRQGIAAGGENGEVISGRDPDASRLIQAVRWSESDIQMPPTEKLSATQVAALERWVKLGAPDPRNAAAAKPSTAKKIDLEQGRQWWAFQPVGCGRSSIALCWRNCARTAWHHHRLRIAGL